MGRVYDKSRKLISENRLEEAYKILLSKYKDDHTLVLLSMQFRFCNKEYQNGLIFFDTYRICINQNVNALIIYISELERSYNELNSKNSILIYL